MRRFFCKVALLSSISSALIAFTAVFASHLYFHNKKENVSVKKAKHHCDWYAVTERLPRLGQIVWVYIPYCEPGERVSIAKYDDDSMEHCHFVDLEMNCSWEDDDVLMWKKIHYPDEPFDE